ncbi:polysaccharide lyase [Aspergillus clavatus NRRL 1]|uniref:Uncharacterized protein n=1 Tax=Aspergillus clavatus (strain ATCC 1007 / CBS 513.65 / DSM 816 / NCTC 3887 / NRRL 1 / QM 1276 / 107) TaxID=344612 RepID=A1C4C8_ASPCL|nr:uncharacterized protein ACLA_059320 [Aspergillus clavatus NRRL 1]EAW15268.1 conserved hypothetical protein [Aspergillus clavatus NRRL 1]
MLPHLKPYLLLAITLTLTASTTLCLTLHTNTTPQTSAIQKIASLIHGGPSSLNLSHIHNPHTNTNPINHTTYQLGDTNFYSFTFYLHEEWQFPLRSAFYLAQFTADFSDQTCNAYRPSGLVYVQGDQLHARVLVGTPCAPALTYFEDLGPVQVGKWHRVSIMVKWAADESGFYHLWFDGVKVLEKEGMETMIDDPRVFEFGLCGGLRCS